MMILSAMYTANLAAFLTGKNSVLLLSFCFVFLCSSVTIIGLYRKFQLNFLLINFRNYDPVSRLHVGLQGVEDLLHQNEFKWGTVFSTNPEILMRNSVKDVYRRIIAKAIDVSDAEAGYAKVRFL